MLLCHKSVNYCVQLLIIAIGSFFPSRARENLSQQPQRLLYIMKISIEFLKAKYFVSQGEKCCILPPTVPGETQFTLQGNTGLSVMAAKLWNIILKTGKPK